MAGPRLAGARRLARAVVAAPGEVGQARDLSLRRVERGIVEAMPEAGGEFRLADMSAALSLANVRGVCARSFGHP